MAIRVIETRDTGWCVLDDRRHMYLNADGRWQSVPTHFASAVEAHEALRARHQGRELAIR